MMGFALALGAAAKAVELPTMVLDVAPLDALASSGKTYYGLYERTMRVSRGAEDRDRMRKFQGQLRFCMDLVAKPDKLHQRFLDLRERLSVSERVYGRDSCHDSCVRNRAWLRETLSSITASYVEAVAKWAETKPRCDNAADELGRWLPSLEAAKERRQREAAREAEEELWRD